MESKEMELKIIEYEKDNLEFLGKKDCTVKFLNYLIKEKCFRFAVLF